MSFLEKKIKDNPAFFDDQEPALGHKKRFVDKLDAVEVQEDGPARFANWMRIAAVAVVFVAASFFVFKYSVEDLRGAVMREVVQIDFSGDIENVFAYYESVTNTKILQIDQLAINDEQALEIKSIAEKQLENLDATLAEIEKEYAKNPDNPRLQAAMVNNKRKKAEVMDNILKQLGQANQPVENDQIMNP
jgi:hypothetical protein